MQFIDAEAVRQHLPYPDLINALEAHHRNPPPLVGRSLLQPAPDSDHAEESFLVLPAWIPGRVIGVKMATVIPANAERGAGDPTIHAAYQLFDGANGVPLACIDGTALTLHKTAADSGLGSRLLARADASTLLMVGAGALAPHLIAAHRAARPSLNRVLIWNRTPARRDALVADLRAQGLDAAPVETPAAGVGEADIICCATAATEPLIQGAWLRPGQHLDLVGAFNPAMRESDDDCVRRAEIFVDLRLSTVDSAGDLVQPIAAGVMDREDVRGDLFELCTGAVRGRSGEEAITLYKNGGGGHLDLFTAEHCWRSHLGKV